jgi:hypothetical protein
MSYLPYRICIEFRVQLSSRQMLMKASFRQFIQNRSATQQSVKAVGIFKILRITAIAYGFLAGFRTLTEYDLGWQLATARWIVEHYQIPSTDVFSYTAFGNPWIYPIGAGLIFYGLYLVGSISCCRGFTRRCAPRALLLVCAEDRRFPPFWRSWRSR